MPLRWSSEPDVQVLAADARADELARALQEELDIGDTLEKISVVDNGRHINFIHDFEANVTGESSVGVGGRVLAILTLGRQSIIFRKNSHLILNYFIVTIDWSK